jgi:hypothetical protein
MHEVRNRKFRYSNRASMLGGHLKLTANTSTCRAGNCHIDIISVEIVKFTNISAPQFYKYFLISGTFLEQSRTSTVTNVDAVRDFNGEEARH